MDEAQRESADRIRALVSSARATPDVFRAALTSVPPAERDAWVDSVLGLDSVPDDGSDLPRGCVPYVPCRVDALLRVVEQADVQASDVFVDIGSGVGRAAAVVHLLTGAAAIGVEVQRELVRASRDLAARLNMPRVSPIEGDAAQLAGRIMIGSVFFLYCPFSGDRLEKVLDDLEVMAHTKPIRVCCVDLPLPPRAWLKPAAVPPGDVVVYRSVHAISAPA